MSVESKREEIFNKVQELTAKVRMLGGIVQNSYIVPDEEVVEFSSQIKELQGELTELDKSVQEYQTLQQSNE